MFSISSLKSLLPFIRPYRKWLIISFFMALPLSLLRVGPLPLAKLMIDEVLINKNEARLILVPFGIIGIYLLNFFVRFIHYYSLRIAVVNVNQKVRERLYRHLIHLSSDHFTEQKAGTLLSRIISDPSQLDSGIASFNVVIREPITFFSLLGYAFYTNWRLAVLTLTMIPLLALLFGRTGKYIKRKIAIYQEQNGESFATVHEAVSGIRIIHLFNLESFSIKRFEEQFSKISKILLKISKMEEVTAPLVELIASFAMALILYYGGESVLNSRMTTGELLTFFAAFGLMLNPIRQLSDVNSKVHGAAAAMERINEFLSWKPSIIDAPNATELRGIHQGIELQNVSFAYPDSTERDVVHSVSFKIPVGKTIALVGQSGSGKSSIVQLLTRLYDVTAGKILVDGHDLRSLQIHPWREKVAVVSQDVFLFHDSIYQNILMGKPTSSKEEVIEAAKKAFAYDFIQQLPDGLETIVGDRGVKLSGGERQRISIARAFLKNADLLILDEATSNLDNQSEKIVQQTLETLMQNKTTLVIAHRLSTIKAADHIIVMNKGKIIEEGHYDQLMNLNGEFKRLAALAGML